MSWLYSLFEVHCITQTGIKNVSKDAAYQKKDMMLDKM